MPAGREGLTRLVQGGSRVIRGNTLHEPVRVGGEKDGGGTWL